MKKIIVLPASLLFVICFYGCPFHYGYEHPNGKIPETPVAISNANSEFDDINMTSPELNEETLLIFSTNRKSSGGNFDLISHPISFHWGKTDGSFYTTDDTLPEFAYLDRFIGLANTLGNEYGPFSFFQRIYGNNQYSQQQYLFYSTDISGTNNINWMSYKFSNMRSYSSQFVPDSVSGPFEIPFLNNKGFDEMYFTLKMSPWINGHNSFPTDNVIESIIYCDNSQGDFNLFTIDIPTNIPFYSFIKKEDGVSKVELSTLNSVSNDRCPYVCGNFMVFSSDRPGGLGGYDLYWSVYENGQWITPVNFSAPVNSSSNEFRAIVNYAFEFDNQLLIFSSDRPGGKGGYDLYYVGIDVMPDVH